MKMQKRLLLFFILAISPFFFIWSIANKKAELPADSSTSESLLIFVRGAEVNVELADTPRKRAQGLSGRLSLGDNTGMLFVFEESDFHGIWMKEMLFPIDIIWIGKSMRVVDIKENAEPQSFPEVFRPEKRAKYVLEVNEGFTRSHSLKIGDEVSLLGL